jgi:GNAT superfamily N-acetyltransferase
MRAMDIEVVQAGPQHSEVIAEFNQAMAIETEGKTLPWDKIHPGINAILQDSSLGFYLVALDQGEVVGCLAITYEWSDWRNALFWWIQSVFVAPQHRAKGVFTAMYSHVKGLASSEAGVCGIRLYVEKENTTAQQTYKKLGMIETHYRIMEEEFK